MLPLALQYGMSTKEFWEESPELFWAYRFSYINKYKEKIEYDNEQAWLQGAYFYEALSSSLSSVLGGKKTSYRNKPFELSKTSSTTEKANALEEQIKARAKKIKELLGGATENEQHNRISS